MMQRKRPAAPPAQQLQRRASRVQALDIFVAHAFGAIDQAAAFGFEPLEADAAAERQGFLRRVEHLDQMAMDAAAPDPDDYFAGDYGPAMGV